MAGRIPLFSILLLTSSLAGLRYLPAAEEQTRSILSTSSLQDLRRGIDPRGIYGSLVIGGQKTPDEAFTEFFKLAGREQSRVVVLRVDTDAAAGENAGRLIEAWRTSRAAELQFLFVPSSQAANGAAVNEKIENATGVWLSVVDVDNFEKIVSETKLERSLTALIKRGGAVGTSAAACVRRMLPNSFVKAVSAENAAEGKASFDKAVQAQPELIGYEIGSAAALVVSGRRIRSVGEGESRILLAAGRWRPPRQIVLKNGEGAADLPSLQRSVAERLGAGFPAKEPPPPTVKEGTLIIIGGGGMPKGLMEQFVQLAGADKARIAIFPTANPDPIPKRSGLAEMLKRLGAKEVTVLPGRTRDVVESDAFLETLQNASGLWFGGGRQWRFVDAYLDTKAESLMHDVLRRGGVIAGSSAGASIQAEYMARGDPLGNLNIMAEGYERGLGFLKGVAIDQHFTQRGRQRDMTKLVDAYPQLLGIGLDETTAIVVQKHIAKVVGKNDVCFYDRNKPLQKGQPDFEIVRDGGSYDLVKRKILDPGAPKEKPKPKNAAAGDAEIDTEQKALELPR